MTTEIEYAQLSLVVYQTRNPLNRPKLPDGWELAGPDALHPDNLGGFSYGVFRRSGTTEIVLAYTGSNEKLVADYAGTNIPASFGLPSIQVSNAALAYEQVRHTYGTDAAGSNITFSGHSLGGGLASVMAVWYNRPAVVFDEAPFQLTATNPVQLGLVRAILLLNGYHNVAMDTAISDFTSREQQVKNYYLSGEILADLRSDFNSIAGSNTRVSANIVDISISLGDKVKLHSQALLTATLVSNAFRQATFTSSRVIPLLMDNSFYAYDATTSDNQNVLINLIRSEQGTGDKLTHFAADLNKLSTNISGLSKAAQDTLIAQGIEWYYWQGADYAGQEFFTQTGESLQYTIALGAGLVGAKNNAAGYAEKWLAPIVNNHGEFYSLSFARDYNQWNIATGSVGASLSALKSDKSQIFIGGAGGDSFTGGDLDDVMFTGAGADALNSGGGNDELYGGADNDALNGGDGYDIYHIEGSDTIEDSDRVGLIKTKSGQRIVGAIEKRSDGSYVFLSDPAISVTGGTELTLTLADGSSATIKNFKDGDLGLNLNNSAVTPETHRAILGDLAPKDFDLATAGVQTRTDDLDNIITDPNQPEPDRADMLFDSAGNDLISGGGGFDYIEAWRGGDDRLEGGAGDDIVNGRDGNDIVIGAGGMDLLRGDAGQDKLYAGSEVTLEAALAAQDAAASGLKGDFIDGSDGDDVAVGDSGNDALHGGQGRDILLGGAGDDTLRGDLKTASVTRDWSISRSVTTDANGITSYKSSYSGVSFSAPTDGGDDVIFAGAGVDWVMAERGDDYVDGGAGDDVLFGEAGSDELLGGTGSDIMIGDSANTPLAAQGADYLDGEDGDDKLNGNGGQDQLFGGAGNDEMAGGRDEDYLDGEEGDDIVIGGAEGDALFGGDGADFLQGDTGDGVGDGDDQLDGEAGDDTLLGLGGQDELRGGLGNDKLQGGDGNDALAGDDGNDQLFGGSGNDALQGGAGTDYLLGGAGDDSLDGGDGNDVYFYASGEGRDRISDAGGTDWLVFNDIQWGQVQLGVGSMKLSVPGGEIHLDDFDADQPLASGGVEYFQFADGTVMSKAQLINTLGFTPTGTPGADVLSGTALADTFRALAGDDMVTARGGNDTVYADEGADVVSAGDGNDQVHGGMGDDMLLGEAGNDTLQGEAGNDLLAGGAGTDLLMGGDGDDSYLFQAGDGQDSVSDALGQNTIVLGADLTLDAVTFGQQGNDLLVAIKNTTDRLTVKDWFAAGSGFASVMRGDGSVLDHAGVEATMPSNQAPLAMVDNVTVVEDGPVTVSGNALANDSDPEGRALRVTNPGSHAGTVGTLTLGSDGAYSYSLANGLVTVQSLADGQSLSERFAYGVTDDDPSGAASSESAIVVSVLGSNDPPQSGLDSASTAEDASPIGGNVLANDHDIDAGTTLTVADAGTRNGNYGTLALDDEGAWRYTLANGSSAVQSLAAGQSVGERFSFNVSDGIAQVGGALSIVIAGQNDAPMLMSALADQSTPANTSWTWQLPAGSFADVDAGDLLSHGATLADGTALPSWLSFDAATQTFSGRVPKSATGSVDIRVGVSDLRGAQACDIFTLSFAAGTGGGGGDGGNGGSSGGNEGVGNGVDGPPPGHDASFNDGPGTGPGNPGAQGGPGYRPPRREDIVMTPVRLASATGEAPEAAVLHNNATNAHAEAPGQVNAVAFDRPGDLGAASALADIRPVLDASAHKDTAAMSPPDSTGPSAAARTPWLTHAIWAALGNQVAAGSDGHSLAVFARWLAVEQAQARQSANASQPPDGLDATSGAGLNGLLANGSLPDVRQPQGIDTLGLRVGAGLQVFQGLGSGMQQIM